MMKSFIKNSVKPSLLNVFFAAKEKFLRAPLPPAKLAEYVWGGASEQRSEIPPVVWMYWHTHEMPVICQKCVSRIRRLNPGFTVHVLNRDTVGEFIPEIASLGLEDKNLSLALYSDLIRLLLLEKYGGFWLDISTIVNVGLEHFNRLNYEADAEMLLFTKPANGYTATSINTIKYPVTESWFLAAVKGSQFVKDWKKEFIACLQSPAPADYYKSHSSYDKYVELLPDSMHEYLLLYISGQVIMRRGEEKYRLLFLDAFEVGYLYSKSCLWNNELTVKLLANVKQARELPLLLKLTNDLRNIAEKAIQQHKYVSGSLLSNLLTE